MLRLMLSPLLALAPVMASAAPPAIAFTAAPVAFILPDGLALGEVGGVAVNSKGHYLVYTRTGSEVVSIGGSRAFAHGGSRLFEFDPAGAFVREIGKDIYGFMAARAVHIDQQDNIWVVDEGSNMIIKFAPDGRVLMTFGRKPEAMDVPAQPDDPNDKGIGSPGDNFVGPTDIAWDKAGNIFVADGSGNARVVKFTADGAYVKAWGGRGAGPGQFNDVQSLAIDDAGNIYAADRGNRRIQIFDNDGGYKTTIQGIGSPTALCMTHGAKPILYSSSSNGPSGFDGGEIYRLDLSGRITGLFGHAGRAPGKFDGVDQIDCSGPGLLLAERGAWRVQKVSFGR